MTNSQLHRLAELRMQYDSAMNNGHFNSLSLTTFPAFCEDLGIGMIEAEELTWPIIAQEIFA